MGIKYLQKLQILVLFIVYHRFVLKCAVKPTDASKSPSWGLEGNIMKDESLARYTGGEIRIEKESDLSMSVVPMPELTHVTVGLESVNFMVHYFILIIFKPVKTIC